MVRLREIPRTAAFAWSPGPEAPLVVTGTRAGAIDADFSDETKLELWDLGLDSDEQGVELQPVASLSTDSRYAYGLSRGGLGHLNLYELIVMVYQIPRHCLGTSKCRPSAGHNRRRT